MKCPKCHKEVEKGSLYCPHCLEEIPWVREFDSVETQMKKQQQRKPVKEKKKTGFRLRKPGKKQIILLLIAAAVILGAFCYRQLHTFSALYSYAQRQFEQENYASAIEAVNDALEQKPDNEAANILLSQIMEKQEDLESAILILKPLLGNEETGPDVYRALVRMMIENGQIREAEDLLKDCSREIRRACGEYICEPPTVKLSPGTYTSVQSLEMESDDGEIYYTMDGTIPTEKSQKYTEPITLQEGTVEVKAVCINEYGVMSKVAGGTYVINLQIPKAPKVSPKSGDYEKKTKIKVTVPDGCTAYYAFDSMPDVNSTVYERPISMPEGYHVLNVILVTDSGKVSKATTREYYLQY